MTPTQKEKYKTIKAYLEYDGIQPNVGLSAWELNFMNSLQESYDLSSKQNMCLIKIFNKL